MNIQSLQRGMFLFFRKHPLLIRIVKLAAASSVGVLLLPGVASSAVTFDLGFGVPQSLAPVQANSLPGLTLFPGEILQIDAAGTHTEQYCLGNPTCIRQPNAITTNPDGLTNPADLNSFVVSPGTTATNFYAPVGSVYGIFSSGAITFSGPPPSNLIIAIAGPDKTPGTKASPLLQGFFIGTGLDSFGSQQTFLVPSGANHFYVGSWVNGDAAATDAGMYTVTVAPAATGVPEPETFALVLAGLALMGTVAARRRKTA